MQFLIVAALAGVALSSAIEKRGATHNGHATFFYQAGNPGSCGEYHGDGDYIVAISHESPFTYNAHCGQTVTITNQGGGGDGNHGQGKTITAKVVDDCPPCGPNDLDLSVGAFEGLGVTKDAGEFDIQWHLN